MLLFLFVVFSLGLFTGSFMNVVIDRFPNKRTIVKGRSKCDFCNKKLMWFELIPVFSFIFLKRRCRYCKKKLSFQYPIIEIVTGILFASSFIYSANLSPFLTFDFFISLIFSIIISSMLLLIFMIDLKYGIIPDEILIILTFVSLVYLFLSKNILLSYFSTALISFLFFLILIVITKGKGMGMGDAKFAFLIGLILGFPLTIISIYLAFLTGALVSIILILLSIKKIKKDTIAFGPFLAGCTLVVYFFGNQILKFLINIINF